MRMLGILIHFESRVFRSAQKDPGCSADLSRGNEPLATIGDKDEEIVEPGGVKGLDPSTPTLIPAFSR